jgi:hypothetical protein
MTEAEERKIDVMNDWEIGECRENQKQLQLFPHKFHMKRSGFLSSFPLGLGLTTNKTQIAWADNCFHL